MENKLEPIRYAVIDKKNKREIVMLRGSGCEWRKCRFCNYHLDSDTEEKVNFALNRDVLKKVTGLYGRLEVINSGSFTDLDAQTMDFIEQVCREKEIKTIHFECHWIHRKAVAPLRERFKKKGIVTKIKIGVETFDFLFRECYLNKGINTESPEKIASYFDEVCLLQGIPGQNAQSMEKDIRTGLQWFERVCVNIMQENGMPVKPDPKVIAAFLNEVYPKYKDNDRVDILLENTEFGVGGTENAE